MKNLFLLHFSEIYFDEIVTDSLLYVLERYFSRNFDILTFKNISFIGNENIDRIIKACLDRNIRLVKLLFINIPLDKTNVKNIAEYVSKINTLRNFHLLNNGIDHFECLATALALNEHLRRFDMSFNKFSQTDLNAFLLAFMKMKSLKHIRLEHCGFSEEEIVSIEKFVLENLKSVKYLFLNDLPKSEQNNSLIVNEIVATQALTSPLSSHMSEQKDLLIFHENNQAGEETDSNTKYQDVVCQDLSPALSLNMLEQTDLLTLNENNASYFDEDENEAEADDDDDDEDAAKTIAYRNLGFDYERHNNVEVFVKSKNNLTNEYRYFTKEDIIEYFKVL
jgi:hypothetical protein